MFESLSDKLKRTLKNLRGEGVLTKEHVDAEWLLSMTLLADPCAFLEDKAAAARLHALLAPYQGLYTVAPVEATFGSVARALGVVASVLERFDAADRYFALAIETERKMKARPWLAHAQHNLAAMLVRPRNTEKTSAVLKPGSLSAICSAMKYDFPIRESNRANGRIQ